MKPLTPTFIKSLVFCALLAGACSSIHALPDPKPSGQGASNQQNVQTDHSGTATLPLVVDIRSMPSPTEDERREKADERHEKAESDGSLVKLTAALVVVTAALVVATGFLWHATRQLATDARNSGEAQVAKMQASLAEASRSATAMESVAEATKNNAHLMQGVMQKQMRAYLVVDVGSGIYQDETKPFGVLPALSNSGLTPAHDMHYWARADILPFPLPDGYVFPEPNVRVKSSMFVGPRQGLQLNAFVDRRVPDSEVEAIKGGGTYRVYVWGKITYRDIFDDEHLTEFCHSIYWLGPEGQQTIYGNYDYHHNKAT